MCEAATNLSYIVALVSGYFLYSYAYHQGIKSQQEKIERMQKYIRQREEMDRKSLEDIQKWATFKQGGKKEMTECPFCGKYVFCNNGEGCDTCRHYEEWLKAEEKECLK